MAGLFGGSKRASPAYQTAGIAPPDLGASILNAIGRNALGVDFERQRLRRALAGKQQEFVGELGQLLEPGYAEGEAPTVGADGNASTWQYTPPVRTRDSLNINSAELPSLALRAQQLGVPMNGILDVLKAQQPDIMVTPTGEAINSRDSRNIGRVFPKIGEGQAFNNGAVNTLPGYAQSVGEIEGAKTGAQERAKAQLDVIPVNMPDGTTVQLPRDVAVQAILGSLAGGGNGIGRTRTPEAASAAKIQGDARAEAGVSLPQHIATAQGALDLISQLRQHPGLDARTGLTAVLPAIPGTPGADFDTMADQLKGKVFLEAFSSLKGAGAITEREGQAATAAIARLNQRQTKAGYVSALNDLERVVKAGMDREQRKAGAQATAPARADVEAELRRRGLIR